MAGVTDTVVILAKPSEVRAYVRPELKRLIKALAGLKNSGKDWTISDCVVDALEKWLELPEQQELIKRHNLSLEDPQDTSTGQAGQDS